MTIEQWLVLGILLFTVAMFLWGRWRHDMVAGLALGLCVVTGLVDTVEAFRGFGHPAVITVACVLVLSRALQSTGAVDALARHLLPTGSGPILSIAALTLMGGVLSAFMNNVGALALLMPLAVQMAKRHDLPPGQVLMPLSFGSILGGMTTLIGTPPNLIVSGFRDDTGMGTFGMFDFAPVGVAVALAGLVFLVLFSRYLVPVRKQSGAGGFDAGAYLTEARVPDNAKAVGQTLKLIEQELEKHDAQVLALVRDNLRLNAPHPSRKVRAGDILVIEAEAEALASALDSLGLALEEASTTQKAKEKAREKEPVDEKVQRRQVKKAQASEDKDDGQQPSEEVVLMELAVLPGALLTGRSASSILLRTRYNINLLAVSRQGQRAMARLRSLVFQAGDLLMVQGPAEAINEFASNYGCVPLAERELRIPEKRAAILSGIIMLLAISGAAFGLVPAAVSFAGGVLASMFLRLMPQRSVYEAVDWPVIVLLASLIPVAGAMESTGMAGVIARLLMEGVAQGNAVLALGLVLVVTMTLSDLMNNAATAAVMCPIAIGAASQLGVNADAFLMAVAIGASCAFLTPIGHQNNTLILGPGGFHFGDYWRLGLPLEIVVVAVSIPMLLMIWPL